MRGRGFFLVLDGPDRSGKSTQARLLAEFLGRRKIPFLLTREPGGSALSEIIRKVLLDRRIRIGPLAELFLYEAARAQHVEETILPALRRGRLVICDRFSPATYAYQACGRGLDPRRVEGVDRWARGGVAADLAIVIDVPESGFRRRGKREGADRMERESASFRRKVREGFRSYARRHRRVLLVDGSQGVEKTHSMIVEALSKSGGLG